MDYIATGTFCGAWQKGSPGIGRFGSAPSGRSPLGKRDRPPDPACLGTPVKGCQWVSTLLRLLCSAANEPPWEYLRSEVLPDWWGQICCFFSFAPTATALVRRTDNYMLCKSVQFLFAGLSQRPDAWARILNLWLSVVAVAGTSCAVVLSLLHIGNEDSIRHPTVGTILVGVLLLDDQDADRPERYVVEPILAGMVDGGEAYLVDERLKAILKHRSGVCLARHTPDPIPSKTYPNVLRRGCSPSGTRRPTETPVSD